MCGIVGFIANSKINLSASDIIQMTDQIYHRGPDDFGSYIFENRIGLGMRRLSIIDLTNGGQPLYNTTKTIVIVFNGEIYNFLELRNDLLKKGLTFKTNSDTEVILLGYEFYGLDFLNKLNGMFSFAIHDINLRKIFLFRDRLGEKPLYYLSDPNFFIFSSELKSIKSVLNKFTNEKLEICKAAMNLYFTLTYIPAPYSIYKQVKKLKPGYYLSIDTESLVIQENKFWEIKEIGLDNNLQNFSYAKLELEKLLFDSVEKRMLADVPLGSFLSGGVDSSIITAVMADIKSNTSIDTFSLISDNKYFDESTRSNSVAKHLNTNHHSIKISINELKETYEKIIINFDEPFADSSAIPTYFISKKTKDFVKVALTGDGGDEVFGGYNRYFMPSISKKYKNIIHPLIHKKIIKPIVNSINQTKDDRGLLFKFHKLINGISNSELGDILNIMSLGFLNEDRIYLIKESYLENTDSYFESIYEKTTGMPLLNKSRYMDMIISLEGDMLTKVDRASMLASLECRAPFLDHRLMEFSYQLPTNFLIRNNNTKFILKDTFKNLLPKGLFDLPKSGFGVPVGDWLRNDFIDELKLLTDVNFLNEQAIFKSDYVKSIVDEHLLNIRDHTFKIWTLFCFQKWYKQNI